MKILIATHHLIDFAGTEIYTATLAKYLVRAGHEVIVYSKYIDKLLDLIEKTGAEVVDNLDFIVNNPPDVAHVHHNITAYEVRKAFPKLPIAYVVHGVDPFLEQLPYTDIGISQYVGISPSIYKKLLNEGSAKKNTHLIHNIIDTDKFKPYSPINEVPKTAIVISSKITTHNEQVISTALSKLNIDFKIFGRNHTFIEYNKIPEAINSADVVISIGRGIIEAIYCERIAVSYDYLGGDGIVKPENFNKLVKNSFNGTTFGFDFTADELADEIMNNYSNNIVKELHNIANKYYEPEVVVSSLLGVYRQAIEDKNITYNETEVEYFAKALAEAFHYSGYYQKMKLNKNSKILAEHTANLEKQLQTITSAKTFIIWQLCVKFKKILKRIINNPKLIIKYSKKLFSGELKDILLRINFSEALSFSIDDINEQYKKWRKRRNIERPIVSNLNLFSILLPTYKSNIPLLKETINSVLKQSYSNWELCVIDDSSGDKKLKAVLEEFQRSDNRIKVKFLSTNVGIGAATDAAFKISSGDFVAFLDHDDILEPHALQGVANAISEYPEADFIYSDEDKLSEEGFNIEPYFKPDWSPNLLLSLNYITHFTVIKRDLVEKVGGISHNHDGSQDYDLFLKTTEKANSIIHIPDILYSWRKVPGSTAAVYDSKNYADKASVKALSDAISRRGLDAIAGVGIIPGTFRVKYNIKNNPKVSIIIPSKDNLRYLKRAISSILEKSTYKNFEILLVDTGSKDPETLSYIELFTGKDKINVLNWDKHFNYSAVNNYAVKQAKGKYLLFLNDDVEIISPDWIESMLEHAQRKEVGAVGAKLLYPNDTIQHAGIVLGIRGGEIEKGVAGHILKMYPDIPLGLPLFNIKDVVRDVSAVTAACLMVSKKKYIEVGGMDEKFRIAFNDVDFNLRLLQKGYQNIYTPYAKLYHHESVSVGDPSKGTRDLNEFSKEISLMHNKWSGALQKDKFYNNNLSLKNEQVLINTY